MLKIQSTLVQTKVFVKILYFVKLLLSICAYLFLPKNCDQRNKNGFSAFAEVSHLPKFFFFNFFKLIF